MDVEIFFASVEVFRLLTGLQILLKTVMDVFAMIRFNEICSNEICPRGGNGGSRMACSERGLYFIMNVDTRSRIVSMVVWGSAMTDEETNGIIRRGYM